MQLELWLDESGNFEDDSNKKFNPSLVGGVLFEKDQITEEIAEEIIGKKFIHYNKEPGKENLELLDKLNNLEVDFVIFQNKERVQIIDSVTTYLNVLAEGIIQLLLQLSAEYGDFELDITIATRKDTVRGYGIIKEKEYKEKLQERIILGLVRKALIRKNKWKYNIHFEDARTCKKLMLADGVCNTYLTRTSRKFDKIQKEKIKKYYDRRYYFSLYENGFKNNLKRWLVENKLSDVIFEIYFEENPDNMESFLEIALKRLSDLDRFGQRLQLMDISRKIETLVKMDRSNHIVKPILIKMQNELIPRLRNLGVYVPEFNLDVILYLYTIYTHEGNILADIQDELFLEELKYVDDMMEKFTYFSKYKLRRAIHQKNIFNTLSSIEDVSQVVRVFEEMQEMHEILVAETGDEQTAPSMFENLGKAYGTRGQAYTMLIHQDDIYFKKAIDDFDKAINHFSYKRDKERQYLYKCSAFCEKNQFSQAIQNLLLACDLDTRDIGELVSNLNEKQIHQTIFKYHHYFKIMAYAKEAGEDRLADSMYESLLRENVTVDALVKELKDVHPIQFILWNMARYLRLKDKKQRSLEYLNKAIKICDVNLSQVTIKVIQLGMYADKILYLSSQGKLKESEDVKKILIDQWRLIRDTPGNQAIIRNLEHIDLNNLKQTVEFARRIS